MIPEPNDLPLHPQAIHGLELFNQGKFFEAHEALEIAWHAEITPSRELYRGILQVSVACHHILRGNYRGAEKLLRRSQEWLAPFPDDCRGINLNQFRQEIKRIEAELLRLGPHGIAQFSPEWFRAIRFSG